jgi:Domain of unknown function (DUF4129)
MLQFSRPGGVVKSFLGVMMKKFLDSRSFILFLGIATLLVMLYLAAGISFLKFKPAQIYESGQVSIALPFLPVITTHGGLWQSILLVVVLLFFMGGLLYAIFNAEQRKRLLIALLRLSLMIALLFLIIYNLKDLRRVLHLGTIGGNIRPAANPNGLQAAAPPPFTPPHLPAWQVYLISLLALLIVAGGVWWIIWLARKSRYAGSLVEFERITRATLDEIQSGKDWEDAVVQCYIRMGKTVNVRHKLARQAAMTPSEFAAQLVKAGLPAEAVRQLTLLFERVRYGAMESSQADVAEAVECLTVILRACQETA